MSNEKIEKVELPKDDFIIIKVIFLHSSCEKIVTYVLLKARLWERSPIQFLVFYRYMFLFRTMRTNVG
jgi:hypothetical protein